jgi:hypothetical protein
MKRKMTLTLLAFALIVGLFATAFTRLVPAPISEPVRDRAAMVCYQAQRFLQSLEIPAHRVDYQMLDRASVCAKVGRLNLVPVTGTDVDPVLDPDFMRFKDHQAEERMEP